MTTDKMLIVPHNKRRSAPLTWGGLDVRLDPSLPADAIELRDESGKVLARAVVEKPTSPAPDKQHPAPRA